MILFNYVVVVVEPRAIYKKIDFPLITSYITVIQSIHVLLLGGGT